MEERPVAEYRVVLVAFGFKPQLIAHPNASKELPILNMALNDKLKAICKDCNAPEAFSTWLKAEELLQPIDVALIASSE